LDKPRSFFLPFPPALHPGQQDSAASEFSLLSANSVIVFLFRRRRGFHARGGVHSKVPHEQVHAVRQNLGKRVFTWRERFAQRETKDRWRNFPSLDRNRSAFLLRLLSEKDPNRFLLQL